MNLAPTGSTVEVLDASLGVVIHEGLDESEGVLDGAGLGDLGFRIVLVLDAWD